MSQTTPYQCPSPTVTFYQPFYDYISHQIREDLVIVGLLAGLYGVLTILSVFSIYSLAQRNRVIQPSTFVLSATILALFTSTTIYMVICILSYQYSILKIIVTSILVLWKSSIPFGFPSTPLETVKEQEYTLLRACAGTATLTLNVILGDAIVCWRACVVWHKNRVVRSVCAIFLLAMCVLGIVDTITGCSGHQDGSTLSINMYIYVPPGSMFEGLPIGIAACVLSLSTNLLATLLVAYKAWLSRRRLREYFAAGPRNSQVQKLLALLVESGAIYCGIWVVIVAFQIKYYTLEIGTIPTISSFLDVFNVFMTGALVPAIAIYPTIIIVFMALNRSHIERGLTQNIDSLPTPHIAMGNNAAVSYHHASKSHPSQTPDVLVINGEGLGCKDDM